MSCRTFAIVVFLLPSGGDTRTHSLYSKQNISHLDFFFPKMKKAIKIVITVYVNIVLNVND